MAKKPTIVEASGSASSSMAGGNAPLAQGIEQAMTEATQQCFDEGITDPEEIKARKLDARQQVKDDMREAAAKQAAEDVAAAKAAGLAE